MKKTLNENISTLVKFVNKQEVVKHFPLKCGDRGRDRAHCNEVVSLACAAFETDQPGFVKLAQEFGDYTLNEFMMAATGRPIKARKSGKKAGAQEMANEIANQALSELAYFLSVPRPDVVYNHCKLGLEAQVKLRASKKAPATQGKAKQQTA